MRRTIDDIARDFWWQPAPAHLFRRDTLPPAFNAIVPRPDFRWRPQHDDPLGPPQRLTARVTFRGEQFGMTLWGREQRNVEGAPLTEEQRLLVEDAGIRLLRAVRDHFGDQTLDYVPDRPRRWPDEVPGYFDEFPRPAARTISSAW